MAAALEAGVTRLLPHRRRARRSPRSPTAPRSSRASTRSSGPATATSPPPRRCVSADCAIDFYAGPTEIVVVAGDRARPDWIAADLVAQAEHDPDARVDLHHVEPRARRRGSPRVSRGSPRGRDIVEQSLAAHGVRSSRRNADEAMDARQPHRARAPGRGSRSGWRRRPIVAGAVFVGPFTAQAAGDYATGSNHVLPTAGAARFRGGSERGRLRARHGGAAVDPRRAARLAPAIVPLARAEGLRAHADPSRCGCDDATTRSRPSCTPASGCTRTRTPAAVRRACSRRSRSLTRRPDGRLSAVSRSRRRPARGYFGVDPGRLLAGQRARRRHPGGRRRLSAAGGRRRASPKP